MDRESGSQVYFTYHENGKLLTTMKFDTLTILCDGLLLIFRFSIVSRDIMWGREIFFLELLSYFLTSTIAL